MGAPGLDMQDDYPIYAAKVARKVLEDPENNRGIMICGSGVGVSIVANRHPKIRSALCWKPEIAEQSRQHENINMIGLPADHLTGSSAVDTVDAFLNTEFIGEERHQRRLKELGDITQDILEKH